MKIHDLKPIRVSGSSSHRTGRRLSPLLVRSPGCREPRISAGIRCRWLIIGCKYQHKQPKGRQGARYRLL